MSEFRRNPSKVWWGNESIEWREVTASPGSQDSGFSDTENSPQNQADPKKKSNSSVNIENDILKASPSEKPQNLSTNFKEKYTPKKLILSEINVDKTVKSEIKYIETPKTTKPDMKIKSEPANRKNRYTKHSPRVSRNLFNTRVNKEFLKEGNQYSDNVKEETILQYSNNNSYEHASNHSHSILSEDESEHSVYFTQSLPVFNVNTDIYDIRENLSAPNVLVNLNSSAEDSNSGSFNDNSLSSDCESELECLFNGASISPKHTSTPKTNGFSEAMKHRKNKLPLQLYLKYQHERIPPILTPEQANIEDVSNEAVKKWMDEIKEHFEPECMTTLQAKSIVADLNEKVSQLAYQLTSNIRGIISHSHYIEREYESLNSEKIHVAPLAQSLVGNIIEYFKNFSKELHRKMEKQSDEVRKSASKSLDIVSRFFSKWQLLHQDILVNEVKKLIDRIEDPRSELELRATVTGITSIILRHNELTEIFIKSDIIPILLILCEKCEGSSVRTLLLRALSTVCYNTASIRQFEKFSGVQIITDTLEDSSRPEPERSEAVALLAQVTAPWIEDNHSIKGLQDNSRKLVQSLTEFVSSTKCCQNLLLCTAALANLTTMDSNCTKYLLHENTIKILLETIKTRGPLISVYLLEQFATLVANMSALEDGKRKLIEFNAHVALLSFLQRGYNNNDVERRLQQKATIALSRLCGDKRASQQIIELGGVDKLVKLCKEKDERYDNDAVLVASLATLRRITDVCGTDILSPEDAQELVEPKLLDSFLAYSSQNESYV